MRVNVKWGKEIFEGIEVDAEQPPLVFKSQLFALTGVLPERQKVMVKAKLLGDDEWQGVKLRDGQTLLLMGSAEEAAVKPPSKPVVFREDVPEDEQEYMDMKQYGAGLENVGNTCYMNATLQLLYSVPELRQSLIEYRGGGGGNPSDRLTMAAGLLFKEMMERAGSVTPMRFLMTLRMQYPQFAEMGNRGVYKQQDAEECFSQVAHSLSESVKVNPDDTGSMSQMHALFGIDFVTVLTCKETDETITVDTLHNTIFKSEKMCDQLRSTETKLKCNIPQNPPIHHVHQGIIEGLKADRQQRSEKAESDVLFEGVSKIEKLPPYVMLHMVRFSYRRDTQQKAKILRKVAFPAVMDLYEFCTEAYQSILDAPRKQYEMIKNEEIGKTQGGDATTDDNTMKEQQPSTSTAVAPAVDPPASSVTSTAMDVDAQQSDVKVPPSSEERTGRYHLMGVLTHKGRNADSGHYVAWVKQNDNQWILFDDSHLDFAMEADIMQLSGGGDWHMAYLLLYKAETIAMPSASPESNCADEH